MNESRRAWTGALVVVLLVAGCKGQSTFNPGTDGTTPTGDGTTSAPTCGDGVKNNGESDVDCGGGLCPKCFEGKSCGSDSDCKSGACNGGVCKVCKVGTTRCWGNLVRTCNADESTWTVVATCDPAKAQVCQASTKSCVAVKVTGTATSTGTYYLYAMFTSTQGFKSGYDVDSIVTKVGDSEENLIYVNRSSQLDVYKVELVDSDKDGKLEPNQHPENAKSKGPVEERKLTFIKTYSNVKLGSPSIGELYATSDRVYFLFRDTAISTIKGADLKEFIVGSGATNIVVPHHTSVAMCLIGYDEINKRWYAANDQKVDSVTRRVYGYYEDGGGWAIEFDWPNLAGGHGDGMEVVIDPKTQIPYVYVSDMTSDFIAQYYKDESTGQWVQKNVFKYTEATSQSVEGMGFGAFQHFWITSGSALYEVGGGDLQGFIGPD